MVRARCKLEIGHEEHVVGADRLTKLTSEIQTLSRPMLYYY